MQNPFTIYFGKKPEQFVLRLSQTREIIDTFASDTPSTQVYMITGIRGCGKTVMMTDISKSLSEKKEWITVELNPERELLSSLAANLYAIPELHRIFIKAKLDFSALGLGVSIENAPPVTDIENAVDKMLSHIRKAGKKLLITIDEVICNENIRIFASSFQIFIRKDYPIFMLMTGLYENIYELQNEKSLTFLYRAPKIFPEPLNLSSISLQYRKVFDISDDEAREMAALTKGYSYAFQVLGYIRWEEKTKSLEGLMPMYDQYLDEYVYRKIWSELSANDKRVIYAISETGDSRVTKIREHLGMSTSEFSVYRDRIKRKGLINTADYGRITLVLPRFDVFALGVRAYEQL